jgi:hypothetical protein
MTEPIASVTGRVISGPDTQAAIWFLGALLRVRISGEQAGGAFAKADNLPGAATPARSTSTTGPTRHSSCSTTKCRYSQARRNTPRGLAPWRCCPGVFATPMSSPPPPHDSSPCTPRPGFEQFAAEVGEPAQALTLPPEPTGPPDFALEPCQNFLPQRWKHPTGAGHRRTGGSSASSRPSHRLQLGNTLFTAYLSPGPAPYPQVAPGTCSQSHKTGDHLRAPTLEDGGPRVAPHSRSPHLYSPSWLRPPGRPAGFRLAGQSPTVPATNSSCDRLLPGRPDAG